MLYNFPQHRSRRVRQSPWVRSLVQETDLTVRNLILPVFIVSGAGLEIPVDSMPGVSRRSPDRLLTYLEEVVALGIPAVALFPNVEAWLKDKEGSLALDPNGLVPNTVRQIKEHFPNLGVICDVALDPYTDHGQDGIPDDKGYLLNDLTLRSLIQMSQVLAQAGADVLAPSDMMDGRIGGIRTMLETQRMVNTMIMSYAAKYASAFYSPFRDAVGSGSALGSSDKKQYQMSPLNGDEALREVAMDIKEGADMVMVKPGIPYLDIVRRVKDEFEYPTYVYHVSGEYAQLQAAARAGYLDYDRVSMEIMQCFRRAGADGILTYCAVDIARRLAR